MSTSSHLSLSDETKFEVWFLLTMYKVSRGRGEPSEKNEDRLSLNNLSLCNFDLDAIQLSRVRYPSLFYPRSYLEGGDQERCLDPCQHLEERCLDPCWKALFIVLVVSEVLWVLGGIFRSCVAIPSGLVYSLWKEVY